MGAPQDGAGRRAEAGPEAGPSVGLGVGLGAGSEVGPGVGPREAGAQTPPLRPVPDKVLHGPVIHGPVLQSLIERVQAARANGSTLTIRGGGSKDFYGETPDRSSEPLDTRGLHGISSYEPSELVVTVGAGTPLAELEAVLAAKGQYLPFEPPHFGGLNGGSDGGSDGGPNGASNGGANGVSNGASNGGLNRATVGGLRPDRDGGATVGGMVAAGLSGPSRAAAGSVRDHVLGATLLNGRAEVLTFGGQVIKNVAGYDVSRLLAGSLGTLGVIVEVSLKVLPIASATATLRFEMGQAAALAQLNEWVGLPLPLNASAWSDGRLVVRLRGALAAVQSARVRLGGEPVEPEAAALFWNGLRHQTDVFFVAARARIASDDGIALWRLSMPPTAPPLALAGELLIEWGGAQRWLCSALPVDVVRTATAQAGGHATRFVAGTPSRRTVDAPGVFAPLSPPLARIHRALKMAFDPDGVFNPGRLYPGV